MREIVASRLWLGNAMDARDLRRIHDVGISAIVDLAIEETLPELTRELIYCRFPINDGAGNHADLLITAIDTTASFIRKVVPTLVVCGAGMSRSPAIVAAALAIVRGESLDDSLQALIAGHPHDVSPLLWQDVKNACNEMAS